MTDGNALEPAHVSAVIVTRGDGELTEISGKSGPCIYGITVRDSSEVRYVGKTVDDARGRLHQHRWAARHGASYKVARWLRSVGLDNVRLVMLERDPPNLAAAERKWIRQLKAEIGTRLTNTTDGGEGTAGRKCSDETKAKIAAKAKGRKATDEQRARMSESQRGRRHTPAAREAIRLAKLGSRNPAFGKPVTDEHRAKISRANLGHEVSAETRAKIGAQRHGKLTSADVVTIRSSDLDAVALGAAYDCTPAHIRYIRRGERWGNVA